MSRHRTIRSSESFVVEPSVLCLCGNHAVVMVEVHAVGKCSPDRPNLAAFRCARCRDMDVRRFGELLDEAAIECPACGCVIVSLSDMVVRQTPIEE